MTVAGNTTTKQTPFPEKPEIDAMTLAKIEQEKAEKIISDFIVDRVELTRKLAKFDGENDIHHEAAAVWECISGQKVMWAFGKLYETAKAVTLAGGGR